MKQKKSAALLAHALSLMLIVILITPLYLMVITSFKQSAQMFKFAIFPAPDTLTLDGYRGVLSDRYFLSAFLNTLGTSAVITVFALLFASMAGYSLAKLRFAGRGAMLMVIISTMMIPFALLMLPLFLVVKSMGLMNTCWAVILPGLPRAYGVFLMRQFMRGIPDDLTESATIDGCGYLRVYAGIVLPLSKPVIFTLATTIFLTSWNSYTWPVIAIQSKNLRLLMVHVASYFEENTANWQLIFSALCCSTLPTLALFVFCQRFLVEGIKLSGIKE